MHTATPHPPDFSNPDFETEMRSLTRRLSQHVLDGADGEERFEDPRADQVATLARQLEPIGQAIGHGLF